MRPLFDTLIRGSQIETMAEGTTLPEELMPRLTKAKAGRRKRSVEGLVRRSANDHQNEWDPQDGGSAFSMSGTANEQIGYEHAYSHDRPAMSDILCDQHTATRS